MKVLRIIPCLFIVFFANCASFDPYDAKVVARGGLFLREDCSRSEKKVTLLPEFKTVKVTREGPTESIDGIVDKWYYAEYEGQKGCLFGGYLNKIQADIDVEAVKSLEKAILLVNNKKYADAIPDLDNAIKISPNYIEAYFWRGQVNFKTRKYEQCIQDFTKVVLVRRDSVAFNNRGVCKAGIRDLKGAKLDFEDSIKAGNANSAITLTNLCATLSDLGEAKAINYCNKAISIDSRYPFAYSIRSQILSREGKTSEADEDSSKYAELMKTYKE